MAGLMLQKEKKKLRHGLDRTKCRDTQISQHSCRESGRADLKEAFVGMPTLKRSRINNAQYSRIPSQVLKGTLNEEVVDSVVAEVAMSGVGGRRSHRKMLIVKVWSVETPRDPA
jgi:hypothetical protein